MNFSVFAHITKATEVSVRLHDSQVGKFCAFNSGDLSVMINDREKLLEIASMLESMAQKWEDEK